MLAAERLVVPGVNAWALRSPRVRARHERLGHRRIGDALADLAPEELGDVLVRRRVDHDVGEADHVQAARAVARLELALALLVGHLQGALVVRR